MAVRINPFRAQIYDTSSCLKGRAPRSTAHAVPRFKQDHLLPGSEQISSGAQAGEAGTHDNTIYLFH